MDKDKKKYIVLVVEDNDGDFLLVEDYLQDVILSPDILRAESFIKARDILTAQTNNINALLLDLSLPDNKGEDLIKDVLAISGHTPIVILTGYADEAFAIKSLSMGASDYLLKDDLNATILYKSIVYAIERKKNEVSLKESEQRYADLFHLSPQPMWVYDINTLAFLNVNRAACDHYGYTPEEFLSMTIKEIRAKEEMPFLEKTLSTRDPQNSFKGTFRHKKKNGESISVEVKSDNLYYNGKNARLVLINDITDKKKAQEELLTIAHQVEDRERTRISINIHDGLQQTLVSSFMHFESVRGTIADSIDQMYAERFLKGVSILNEGIEQARTIAHELMPQRIEEDGYVEALARLLTQNEGSVQFTFNENLEGRKLPQNIALILFRISQEAISNILKHAQATEATINVEISDGLINLTVIDNGVGFDTGNMAANHSMFGLRAIESRINSLGGRFAVESSKGRGTSMSISVPVN